MREILRNCPYEVRPIPACAGSAITQHRTPRAFAAHPCVGRGYASSLPTQYRTNGPSLRAQGIFLGASGMLLCQRSIPMRVGNTLLPLFFFAQQCGPSPRVQGIHDVANCPSIQPRAIPSRGGNTCQFCGLILEVTDHPCVCGEYLYSIISVHRLHGPSLCV